MKFFWKLSLRRKLTAVIVLVSVSALLLACAGFIGFEYYATRKALVHDLTSLTDVLGFNSRAALRFQDKAAAETTLASMQAKPNIVAASLFTPDRKMFATWSRNPAQPGADAASLPEGCRFTADRLWMFQPVMHDGEKIGYVCLVSDLREITDRVRLLAGIVCLVLIVAGLAALGLSAKLQSVVTQPILQLAEIARQVSEKKDYSLRAPKACRDEVGALIDSFNEMLDQIERSDGSLKAEIAERKLAEEKLQQFAARLEASNRELTDFAYVASHDLQEPLRKIQAFGDRLHSKFAATLGETGKDYLKRMSDAASRMQTLIIDLLQFSRVTTKAQPFTPVDLNEIARGVLSDLEVRIEQTKGRVEVDHLPQIDADALQMRQLFQNLIGNALKFRKHDTLPVIRITGAMRNGSTPPRLELVVADNGIGFEQKHADRIFVIFQRLHGRSEFEGTGIGLAICKKIVERHGGSIQATSAPGDGATFTISLPVKHKLGDHQS
jgi:signal transduction histidine kinase